MMSQNRQAEIDRRKAEIDYRINIKAELEIEQLHQKTDLLREQAVMQPLQAVKFLLRHLNSAERREASSSSVVGGVRTGTGRMWDHGCSNPCEAGRYKYEGKMIELRDHLTKGDRTAEER